MNNCSLQSVRRLRAGASAIAGLAALTATPSNAWVRAQHATVRAANREFRLEVRTGETGVHATLTCLSDGRTVANGPIVYAAQAAEAADDKEHTSLRRQSVRRTADGVVVRGTLAGLGVEHTFRLPAGKPWVEERIVLRNDSRTVRRLKSLEVGVTVALPESGAAGAGEAAADRWAAVPFRHRATQGPGEYLDFDAAALLDRPGWTVKHQNDLAYTDTPERHRPAEGWAWTRRNHAVGIYSFCQDHMRFSVLTAWRDAAGKGRLRLGGVRTVEAEPSALAALSPGTRVDLGITRFVSVCGGYTEAAYAYRAMLDEHGCRFPRDYDPPVHWEQLYDMWGAWDSRPDLYTLDALRLEAAKGVAYSCEALYLDPGWDDLFGTFRWGPWLGKPADLVRELSDRYGLKLALHCPLATWATHPAMPMGPFGKDAWPRAARRALPDLSKRARVPAVRNGRRNLALLPGARVSASSVFEEGKWPIHQVAHIADGWHGNQSSWIAGAMPAWAEVDLGARYRVGEVRIGNDQGGQYTDRAATRLRIVGTVTASGDGGWTVLASRAGGHLLGDAVFRFAPTEVRRVRIEIVGSDQGLPRLDEVEVYDADPVSVARSNAHEREARRGPVPSDAASGSEICLGSSAYLDEASRRLEALCTAGAAFLMYDGNWYPGDCGDRSHGHQVPYTWEAHMRANLELARRVHTRFPDVLIEMHDMLAGGSPARPTPVYYKYGLPGSYDDNWGLELMWDPMADLTAGRALALYYYNLACNVPMYLHINLKYDNLECVMLWWYASTCRHLGIGGTHADPRVAEAQRAAMAQYRAMAPLFKRGQFHGFGEEVHTHTLAADGRMAVNVFNLTDAPRTVEATVPLAHVGLKPGAYGSSQPWARLEGDAVRIRVALPPWSARVCEVNARRAAN